MDPRRPNGRDEGRSPPPRSGSGDGLRSPAPPSRPHPRSSPSEEGELPMILLAQQQQGRYAGLDVSEMEKFEMELKNMNIQPRQEQQLNKKKARSSQENEGACIHGSMSACSCKDQSETRDEYIKKPANQDEAKITQEQHQYEDGVGETRPISIKARIPPDLVECGICLEVFVHPKTLPCSHTFCRGCLEDLRTEETSFLCPQCRTKTIIPDRGMTSFPDNCYAEALVKLVNNGSSETVNNDDDDEEENSVLLRSVITKQREDIKNLQHTLDDTLSTGTRRIEELEKQVEDLREQSDDNEMRDCEQLVLDTRGSPIMFNDDKRDEEDVKVKGVRNGYEMILANYIVNARFGDKTIITGRYTPTAGANIVRERTFYTIPAEYRESIRPANDYELVVSGGGNLEVLGASFVTMQLGTKSIKIMVFVVKNLVDPFCIGQALLDRLDWSVYFKADKNMYLRDRHGSDICCLTQPIIEGKGSFVFSRSVWVHRK